MPTIQNARFDGGIAGPSDSDSLFDFDLGKYFKLALKHRLVIIGAVIASLVLGVAITLLSTPNYTATSTIQIDREATRVLNVGDVQPSEPIVTGLEFLETQYGLLESRSLAERVVDTLGLASSNRFLEQMGASPPRAEGSAAAQAARRRDETIELVQKNLGIRPVKGSRLVVISFTSPDPALSAQITNAYADNFIQSNLDRKFESTSYVRSFLEERLTQAKARLEEAERQLVGYATRQQIVNLTEGSANGGSQNLATNELSSANTFLAQSRSARIAAEERWRRAANSNPLRLPEVLENPAVQRLVEERARANAEYEQKSQIYQADFPEMIQLRARIAELDGQINTLATNIRESIRGQYQIALNQERSLQRQVDQLVGDVLDIRGRSVNYGILQRDLDTNRALYDTLLQRYREVGVTGGVTANNISIVDRADVPDKPSSPKLLINLAVALLLGGIIGVGAALLMEVLDETLAVPEDVEAKLGLPVLGLIPQLDRDQSPLEALAEVRSPLSEAYHSLRTALQFSTSEGAPRTLLVTSSRPGEGKSTTAYATALNLARIGRRVLLVDGDLRNPSMHRLIGVDNERGTSNLLSGAMELQEVLRPTGHENLSFVSAGPLPPNPAELWGSDRLRQILYDGSASYDHIVIDGPPVLGFADAPLLAAAVAGTIFVVEARGTRRGQARGALGRLASVKAEILGLAMTKFNAKAVSYGGYDYTYDYTYGQSKQEPGRRGGLRKKA